MAAIARVALDLAAGRLFDYEIPEALRGTLSAGTPVLVPFGASERRGYVVELCDTPRHAGPLKAIKGVAGKDALIREPLLKLAQWMADYYLAPVERAVRAVLPGAVRKQDAGFVERLLVAPTEAARALGADALAALARRAPKQAAALERVLTEGEMLAARLAAHRGAGHAALRALEKKGLLRLWGGVTERDPNAGLEWLPTRPLTLMPQQTEAIAAVREEMDAPAPGVILLYGVTGSGKTEVYLQALRHALDLGRGTIVLVPEISLTPQTVERFRGRFGDVVAVLHSGLSEGERHDEWHRIHDGRARVVVGARSALFAPVRDLGLIVVDEEHEPAYKQEETPRYHARDVAVMRGKMEGCAVVLGTATPSLESWQNARAGKYRLVRMPHRVDHRAMPEIHIIDLRSETSGRDQKRGLFAGVLVDELRGRTQSGEQAILFLNRRGYARALICPACGEAVRCPDCSIALAYHKREDRLRCHICGRTERPPTQCPNPACGDPAIRMAGAGTEKVEELLRRLLPGIEVARMDSDTMTRRDEYRRVLTAFRSGKIQVLIGTQMIAKGLHFPNVTLVGVINADVTLHLPDFRAGERTLQLLTQVAGRAGRGEAPGRVLVQTFTPFHPAIQAARRMDFETFCDQELEFRKELSYPPFSRMINVLFRGRDEAKVRTAATAFATAAAPPAPPPRGWTVSEALPAALARAHGEYRYQVLLRGSKANRAMHDAVRRALELKRPKDVHASADVDPVSVM